MSDTRRKMLLKQLTGSYGRGVDDYNDNLFNSSLDDMMMQASMKEKRRLKNSVPYSQRKMKSRSARLPAKRSARSKGSMRKMKGGLPIGGLPLGGMYMEDMYMEDMPMRDNYMPLGGMPLGGIGIGGCYDMPYENVYGNGMLLGGVLKLPADIQKMVNIIKALEQYRGGVLLGGYIPKEWYKIYDVFKEWHDEHMDLSEMREKVKKLWSLGYRKLTPELEKFVRNKYREVNYNPKTGKYKPRRPYPRPDIVTNFTVEKFMADPRNFGDNLSRKDIPDRFFPKEKREKRKVSEYNKFVKWGYKQLKQNVECPEACQTIKYLAKVWDSAGKDMQDAKGLLNMQLKKM